MMTGRTKPSALTPSDLRRQRRRLAEWLDEWRLEQALSRADALAGAAAGMECPDAAVSADPVAPGLAVAPGRDAAPAAGQVRLMMPDNPATRRRPLYVLILTSLPSDAGLIIPFGILATPAIPGEWRTGWQALPVRVLCIWNARRVTLESLRRSWHVRDVEGRRLAMAQRLALDVFAWPVSIRSRMQVEADARPVPANVLGPPLVHPLDPRWQYLATESERLDVLGPPPATVDGDVGWRGQPMPGSEKRVWAYENFSAPRLSKAAEPRGDYSGGRHTRK